MPLHGSGGGDGGTAVFLDFPAYLSQWYGWALDFGRPDFARASGQVLTNLQAITPMTERSSRYHFTVGVHRLLDDGEKIIGPLVDMTRLAFGEDKRMIEMQQQVLHHDLRPDYHAHGARTRRDALQPPEGSPDRR